MKILLNLAIEEHDLCIFYASAEGCCLPHDETNALEAQKIILNNPSIYLLIYRIYLKSKKWVSQHEVNF